MAVKDPVKGAIEIIEGTEEPKKRCPKWGCFSGDTGKGGKIFIIGYGYQNIHRCNSCGLEWCYIEKGGDDEIQSILFDIPFPT